MVTGLPPTVSLTISCQVMICKGYARASPFSANAMTGSSPLTHCEASVGDTNEGLSSGGMPSRGGPPERICSYGTLCFEKSVFHSETLNLGWSDVEGVGAGVWLCGGVVAVGSA